MVPIHLETFNSSKGVNFDEEQSCRYGAVWKWQHAHLFSFHVNSIGRFGALFSNCGRYLRLLLTLFHPLFKYGLVVLSWIHTCEGIDFIDNLGWWTKPSILSTERLPLHSHLGVSWQPSTDGDLKFNVDSFTKDSNYIELMAILYTLRLFALSPFVWSNLIIEFDLKNALSWVANESQRPWDSW
ncbi:Uncharacterized protein TCM_013334 [Theobroma cacao]|uniref:RNase H type-1 domain-containing protein n=1 Tax=Theobroma cacao TaxID=3641 RepID=A0A061FXE7_THECC|nr:Uncharacterized protein TCM_013334 [Theobroma cacao]